MKTDSELLTALDNSLWIPDGAASDKQIYVIAGPFCAYSQALYRDARRLTGAVQFRWVEMAPTLKEKCLGYVAEAAVSKDASLLVKMYETLPEPARVPVTIRDPAIRWNGAVERSVRVERIRSSTL